MRTVARSRRPAVVRGFMTAVLVAVAACDPRTGKTGDAASTPGATREGAPSDYQSLTGGFSFAVPAAWSASVRIIEEPGASAALTWPGVKHAVHFVYQPTAPGAKQGTLLSILVYADTTFDRDTKTAKVAARPPGEEVARGNGRVLLALVSSSNPYTAGPDRERYQGFLPSVASIKGAISLK